MHATKSHIHRALRSGADAPYESKRVPLAAEFTLGALDAGCRGEVAGDITRVCLNIWASENPTESRGVLCCGKSQQ